MEGALVLRVFLAFGFAAGVHGSAIAASLDGRWVDVGTPCSAESDFGYRITGSRWTFGTNDGGCTVEHMGKVKMECQADDETFTRSAEVTLNGDTLTVVENGETTNYMRCREVN